MAGKTMIPLLAFAAWSGTGKTTLLKKLIPALCARGIRPGLIKHTFFRAIRCEIDGDAYLRLSGCTTGI